MKKVLEEKHVVVVVKYKKEKTDYDEINLVYLFKFHTTY